MSFLKTLEEYFKKNWKYIAIVVGALFLITAIIAIRGIEFKQNPNKQLEKIILYEKFSGREGMQNDEAAVLEDGFCDRPADVLRLKCRNLQEKGCKNSNCCIWGRPNTEMEDPGEDPITNPEGCYYGDETGAKFNNSQLNLDYWYYKGKDRDSAERFPKGKIPVIEPIKDPEGKEGLEANKKEAKKPIKDPKAEAQTKKNLAAARDKLAEKFKDPPPLPVPDKDPHPQGAAAAAAVSEKEDAEREHEAETQEQTHIRMDTAENRRRQEQQFAEGAHLRLKHELANRQARLNSEIGAADQLAHNKKKMVAELQLTAAKKDLEKKIRAADEQTVEVMVDNVIANRGGPGSPPAPTDLAEIANKEVLASRAKERAAQGQADLETKERELQREAVPKPMVAQVAPEYNVSSNSRREELAAAIGGAAAGGGNKFSAITGGSRAAALSALRNKFGGNKFSALKNNFGGKIGGAQNMAKLMKRKMGGAQNMAKFMKGFLNK